MSARSSGDVIARAAEVSVEGANPLPETGYKIDFVAASVIEVLESVRDS